MRTGDIKVTNVYRTNNLGQFKIMIDNREVKEQRIKTLMDSISRNGWLHAPIMVNERNEVIWLATLRPTMEAIENSRKSLELGLIAAYVNPAADNDRMAEQLQRQCRQVAEVSTIDGALKELSRIYNIRIRGPKVYLDTDYAKLKEGMEALK